MSDNILKLRPYQVDGVKWLTDAYPHKLLADDMGLGKTPQCIAAMNLLGAKRVVVVCPATVKVMWARRLAQWGADIGQVFIVKTGKDKIPPHADIIILNYDLLIRAAISKQIVAKGQQRRYDVAIFDEARALKNREAERTKAALGRRSFVHNTNRVWLLDGTPVPNRPVELYAILSTLAPEVIHPYQSYTAFGEYFCKGRRDVFGWDMSGHSNMEELSERLVESGFFLRRTKEQVMDELPDKIETVIDLDIVPPCDVSDTPVATVRRELALAKVPLAASFINETASEVGKVVVFAHHRDVIEQIQEALEHLGAVILYGGMNADEKQKSIDSFITNPDTQVLISQTVAGGSGVDGLQDVCNNIVFVELDWSPGVMDQAVDRCRRIGQTKSAVFVYYLSVPDSIDTAMNGTLSRKRNVISQLIKEVPILSQFSPEFEAAAADALRAIAASMHSVASLINSCAGLGQVADVAANVMTVGEEVAAKKPAAAKKTTTAKKEQTPDPEVKEVPVAVETAKLPTIDDVTDAVSVFLAGTAGQDRIDLIDLYKVKILQPIAGVDKLKEADPTHYAAIMEALAEGPQAYKTVVQDDDI